MSEKKSRVSRYQKLHVDANEFKKQQVVNEEGIKRLQRFQNLDLNDEKGIVDVNKSASTKNEMQMMESFANNVVRSRVQKSKVFVIEENTLEEPIQPIIEEVEKPIIEEVVSLDDIMSESILDSTCEEISTDLFEPVFIEEELINEVIKKTGEDTTMLEDLKETLAVEEMQEIVIEEVEEDYIIDEIIEEDYVEVEVIDKDDIVVVETVETVAYEEKEEIKPSKRRKKTRKERWHNFGMGFFTFCNVCALICFFVVYGPFHQVRDAFVTTAMSSMTKKFLANVLYSNATIQDVLATNITIEPNEVMDSNAISIGNLQAPEVYSSVYEEQILKRGEGEDLYKIVRLDEDGYEGYAVFVYDPTKIGIATTKNLGSA
ncbi:MAG: hypothetical protein IKY26_00295, partial [Erysipelotrichaceae bacterium]|nr:hypothetical protein [Erysipelotrichaceae bacterium]